MKSTANGYGRLAQTFHWISALLIIALWPMGIAMTRIADSAAKTTLYQAHTAVGSLILLLTIMRVVWRLIDATPEPPVELTPPNQKLFRWIHNLLNIVVLLLTLSGIAMLFASGLDLSTTAIDPDTISDSPSRVAHAAILRLPAATL